MRASEGDSRQPDPARLQALRSQPSSDAATLLRDCRPGHVVSSRNGDLCLFDCASHWQGPYIPPLTCHMVVVAAGPAVACATWLAHEGLRHHTLHPGHLMTLPAGEPAYLQLADPHRLLLLAIRPAVLTGALAGRPDRGHGGLAGCSSARDGVIEGFALSLRAAASQGPEAAVELADLLVGPLARQLLARRASPVPHERPRLGHARLERVLTYLDEHLDQPVTLEDVARVAGCTVHHLSHLFKEEMGQSPMRYLNHMRMQRARALVESSRLSMGEIALQVGLSSAARFSQAFRAYWRTTPTALRCAALQRAGAEPAPASDRGPTSLPDDTS